MFYTADYTHINLDQVTKVVERKVENHQGVKGNTVHFIDFHFANGTKHTEEDWSPKELLLPQPMTPALPGYSIISRYVDDDHAAKIYARPVVGWRPLTWHQFGLCLVPVAVDQIGFTDDLTQALLGPDGRVYCWPEGIYDTVAEWLEYVADELPKRAAQEEAEHQRRRAEAAKAKEAAS